MVKIYINRTYRNPGESDDQYKDRQKEVVNRVVKKFKKMIDKDGILKDVVEKRFFSKPSEIRRADRKKGIKEWRKKELKLNRSFEYQDKR